MRSSGRRESSSNERHPSMRLSAARALEQGEVCAAERDAEKAAAKAWFERAAAR